LKSEHRQIMKFSFHVLLLAGALFAGCSSGEPPAPDRAVVTGKLTIDGQPLKGGSIAFALQNQKSHRTSASIKEDGTYQTKNAPIGNVVITVETKSILGGGVRELYVEIPDRYNNPESSGLTGEVKAGMNELSFDLER